MYYTVDQIQIQYSTYSCTYCNYLTLIVMLFVSKFIFVQNLSIAAVLLMFNTYNYII